MTALGVLALRMRDGSTRIATGVVSYGSDPFGNVHADCRHIRHGFLSTSSHKWLGVERIDALRKPGAGGS